MVTMMVSDAITDVTETQDAKAALLTLSVLLWPLWVLAGIGWLMIRVSALWSGLHTLGRGLRDLARQVRGRPAQPLPRARARRTTRSSK